MKQKLLRFLVLFGCPACLLIGAATLPAYGVISGILWGRNVQTITSSDGEHRAVLLRKENLADINFIVKVDGKTVYRSPDLMPFSDRKYRETLLWDKTERIVVLELMGKRVFAYDTVTDNKLGKGEIGTYTLYPMPSDYVYIDLKDIDD